MNVRTWSSREAGLGPRQAASPTEGNREAGLWPRQAASFNCCRWSFCLLVAIFATGCTQLRGFRNDPLIPINLGKSNRAPNDNASASARPTETIPGGTVVSADGKVPKNAMSNSTVPVSYPPLTKFPAELPNNNMVASGPGAMPAPVLGPGPASAPLPQPRPWPQQANGQPPQPQPVPQPQPAPPAYYQQPSFADPHSRATPTVTGGRLELTPWEVPTDRVIELTKQIELLLAQNGALLARIKELETGVAGREQSLNEATREIEAIAAAAAKERVALQSHIEALQGKIKQMEEEDIQFLEAVIESLKKLLPPEKLP